MTSHPERRVTPLSDDQIEALADALADRVADKAYERFTAYIGRSVLKNILYLLVIAGAGIVAIWKLRGGGAP